MFVNNGGVKKDWKKEWSVGRGVRETSLKQLVTKQSNICLNNRNFNVNLPNFLMAYGVTGNTSVFGTEESRFEP